MSEEGSAGHEPQHEPRRRASFFARLRANFLTGLVVIAPIGLTVWLFWTVIGWIDGFVLPFVPGPYRPDRILDTLFGIEAEVNVRGVGVVFFLLFTILVGWLAKGLIGRSFIRAAERLVDRMPVIRSVYNALKQIAETVFSQSETSFDKACLVEYPRKGIWAIAFVSTTAKGEIQRRCPPEEQLMSVFLPTTPNPTSGFLLFVPRSDIIMLDMSVEDAAKLVISAGLVYPNGKDPTRPPETGAPAPAAGEAS
ncbi:Uncharacterized membrane protein [Meinhardsimonia xiamenensis]|jgi:uncharacterized membrane protein|uniref:Uncharacterized membrane protein n=1 Tax=Meinhardsimonia xiamenensis TaxID=990712 RepID=A0A1G9GMN8_9RHOB|nr:DUF502 domain-containing protein [Meinhardsimonia xiamenensis]PRX30538.1 putative membrane protein [Meinhardsimonia xiamenensis]SDL01949.1 Uncharacterized membrane protein [Meinhardsimonia xiamenensis]